MNGFANSIMSGFVDALLLLNIVVVVGLYLSAMQEVSRLVGTRRQS
jgi:hypothetical protein